LLSQSIEVLGKHDLALLQILSSSLVTGVGGLVGRLQNCNKLSKLLLILVLDLKRKSPSLEM